MEERINLELDTHLMDYILTLWRDDNDDSINICDLNIAANLAETGSYNVYMVSNLNGGKDMESFFVIASSNYDAINIYKKYLTSIKLKKMGLTDEQMDIYFKRVHVVGRLRMEVIDDTESE